MSPLKYKLLKLKEELEKSMNNVGMGGKGSFKAGANLPSINTMTPKIGNNSATASVNLPKPSKKNPIKQAQQIQNKDIKDMKMKEAQQKLAMQKEENVVKFEDNGQWSVQKSNYKGYTEADNARRKAKNLGEDTGIKSMPRIKRYGGSGHSAAAREAAEAKKKSKKNPVKVYSKEEISQINRERDLKKTAREEIIETLEKKLCERGKAAAKRKFDVYPSAYANMYASAVCSGKVKPGGKKKETKKSEQEIIKYDKNGQWSLE